MSEAMPPYWAVTHCLHCGYAFSFVVRELQLVPHYCGPCKAAVAERDRLAAEKRVREQKEVDAAPT